MVSGYVGSVFQALLGLRPPSEEAIDDMLRTSASQILKPLGSGANRGSKWLRLSLAGVAEGSFVQMRV